MQGIPFALEAFAAGLSALDWALFHGHYTVSLVQWLM
jgi:hypothetical protein